MCPPEQALAAERRAFGVDHPVVGGVLLRRWGLPPSLARIVERHHDPGHDRDAATLHLADLVAHHGAGRAVSPQALAAAARSLELETADVRALLWDQSGSGGGRRRPATSSPLSERESEVLVLLADGLHYREIADVLGVAVSTARTHLHNIYRKLGVANRAQAVLKAAENRWLPLPSDARRPFPAQTPERPQRRA